MTQQGSFRQRLDTVLRTLDVKQVQEFLIAEKQWGEGQPADPNFAMWMMIAGSPTLRDLHDRAYQWLITNGHEADAAAFIARDKMPGSNGSANRGRGGSPSDMPKFTGKKSGSSKSTKLPGRQGHTK